MQTYVVVGGDVGVGLGRVGGGGHGESGHLGGGQDGGYEDLQHQDGVRSAETEKEE